MHDCGGSLFKDFNDELVRFASDKELTDLKFLLQLLKKNSIFGKDSSYYKKKIKLIGG